MIIITGYYQTYKIGNVALEVDVKHSLPLINRYKVTLRRGTVGRYWGFRFVESAVVPRDRIDSTIRRLVQDYVRDHLSEETGRLIQT